MGEKIWYPIVTGNETKNRWEVTAMLKYGIKYTTEKGQRMVGFRTLKDAKTWGYRRMARTGERFEIVTL